MTPQELSKLVLKRLPLMMFLLVHDVSNDRLDLGLAHREGPIPSLPFKLGMAGEVAANPRVGGSFEFLDPVGQ